MPAFHHRFGSDSAADTANMVLAQTTFGNPAFKRQKVLMVLISWSYSQPTSLFYHCHTDFPTGQQFSLSASCLWNRQFSLTAFMSCQNWDFWIWDCFLFHSWKASSETPPFLFGPHMCSHNTIISGIRWIKTEKPERNTCRAKQQIWQLKVN